MTLDPTSNFENRLLDRLKSIDHKLAAIALVLSSLALAVAGASDPRKVREVEQLLQRHGIQIERP